MNDVSNMDILNNLAHGKTGQNTFRTLTNKYFDSKDMVGISLKKVPTYGHGLSNAIILSVVIFQSRNIFIPFELDQRLND